MNQPIPIRGSQPLGRNTNQPQGSNVEHASTGTEPKVKKKKKYYSFKAHIDKNGTLVTERGPLVSASSSSTSSSSDDSHYSIVIPRGTTFTMTGQSFSNQLIRNNHTYTASYGYITSTSTTVTACSAGATILINGKNTGKTTVDSL